MLLIQKRILLKYLPILFWIANYLDTYLCIFRFLDGTAFAATWASSVSILMKVFPNKVSTIIAWNEMFFGLGYALGNFTKCKEN